MDKVFYLSGGLGRSSGLGDCIYSLPAVKAMGGGTFVYGGAYKSYQVLKPLFEVQPYIKEFKHVSEIDLPRDFINLDLFRNCPLQNKDHIVNNFLVFFGFPDYDWNKGGWLENIPTSKPEIDYAVINITPRYRDKIFPKIKGWQTEINKYLKLGLKVYFLGDIRDWVDNRSDKYVYIKTPNLLEVAVLINNAKYFSGTQSALLAIRQGLGLPYRFEQSPHHVDVNQYSKNETVINPISRRIHYFYISIKKLITGKN